MTDLMMVSIVLSKETWMGKNDGTYFFSIICPLALVCSPAVPMELPCGLVIIDFDVEVNLSVVCLLYLEII